MDAIFKWMDESALGVAIRESSVMFPWIESVHVLAITLVVGSIAVVDLRLMGIASRNRAISRLNAEILPITWVAFIFAVITGLLMFTSNAVRYSHNPFFIAKMALLVLALINILMFHLITSRGIERWDESPSVPAAVRAAGAISLTVWIGVVVTGRWIGFTMSPF